MKLAIATAGSATPIPGTAATGLYVNPTDSALRDNGKVDVASLDQYTPGQQLMAASLPVAIASNQSAVPVSGTFWQATQPVSGTFWQATQPISGTVTATQATATSLRIAGGDAAGLPTAGTVLAVQGIASGTALPVSGTFWQATQPVSGTVTANAGTGTMTVGQATGTNLHVVVDTAPTTAVTGTFWQATQPVSGTFWQATQPVSGTVTARVVGNSGAIFDAATAAAVPANIIYNGFRGATTVPTAVTDGQAVGVMGDKYGRTVVQIGAPRDLIGTATLDSSSGTTVSFITAGAAGVFNDISSLVITNDSATATIVSLSDNGAAGNIYKFALAANGGIAIDYNPPLPQGTAAAAWQVLNSAAVSLHYIAVFLKNK